MQSDGCYFGDDGVPYFNDMNASPVDSLEEYQPACFLSSILLPEETHNNFNEPLHAWNSVAHISSDEIKAHAPAHAPLYSLSPQCLYNDEDDYTITSLDVNTVTSNDSSGYTSSDIPSPETLSNPHLSPSSPDETFNEQSVTSRLKSVLLSRQKNQNISDASSMKVASPSKMHSYSSLGRKRKYDSIRAVSENTREKYSPSTALRFPPCIVCGGTASGLHYGINSCEPCKGFFTRYLRKKEEYKCAKDNNCQITNRLRGNCSACRLKKCLALGMSRKNSRLGRYSLSRRMETIMQVNELDRQNTDNTDHEFLQRSTQTRENLMNDNECSGSVIRPPHVEPFQKSYSKTNKNGFSSTLKSPSGLSPKLVKILVEYMDMIKPYGEDLVTEEQIKSKLRSHYESYKLKIGIFGNLKSVPKDEYFNLLKGFGIEIDSRMMFLKQSANEMIEIIERYCNFAKQIPNFKALSNRDQTNLLKSSRYDFFMILMHGGYLHEEQVFLAHSGAAFHMEEVADKFFSRKLVINVCDMYRRLQNLKLSKEENALLIAISLVFTDRCSLENPVLVEQIQFSLVQLLQKQLDRTCPCSASKRFTKIIDCLTIMRESSELFLKEYSQLCQDEMVIEEVPIMTELLFED